jgi:cytosine deaminase
MPDSAASSEPSSAAPTPPPLLLSGALLADGRRVDVRVGGGRIEAVGCVGSLNAPERIDLTGYLLLPAPAEPHSHLDTAFTAGARGAAGGRESAGDSSDGSLRSGSTVSGAGLSGSGMSGSGISGSGISGSGIWGSGMSGSAASAAEADGAAADSSGDGSAEIQRRVIEGALTALGYGATAQRTHIQVGDVHGLAHLEAALSAAQAVRGLLELQTVAQPRLLTGLAGADGRALLRDAAKAGVTAVGGCPELDPDPAGFVEELLTVATEFGCAVDVHTDGADPARLARVSAALAPLRPRVALGPLTALPTPSAARAVAVAGAFAVCLPQSGACTGCSGHEQRPAGGGERAAFRSLAALRAAGARLAAGSGGQRDLANPVGRADPLEAAFLLAANGDMPVSAAYDAVSGEARAMMGLPEVRIDAGFPAELLAVRGDSLTSVLSGGHSRVVLHAGRVVSRTSAVREFSEYEPTPAVPRQGGRH